MPAGGFPSPGACAARRSNQSALVFCLRAIGLHVIVCFAVGKPCRDRSLAHHTTCVDAPHTQDCQDGSRYCQRDSVGPPCACVMSGGGWRDDMVESATTALATHCRLVCHRSLSILPAHKLPFPLQPVHLGRFHSIGYSPRTARDAAPYHGHLQLACHTCKTHSRGTAPCWIVCLAGAPSSPMWPHGSHPLFVFCATEHGVAAVTSLALRQTARARRIGVVWGRCEAGRSACRVYARPWQGLRIA